MTHNAAARHLEADKMDSPFFSIVVPAYNTAPYLPRCIGSLLDQPFRDFEILLVDDGSTDDTGTVIDTLAAKDHRVRGFHIPHGGVSAARNQGLRMAKGSYVLFVDSDDALVPDALGHIYRNLGDAPDMLCFGPFPSYRQRERKISVFSGYCRHSS